MSAQSSTAVTCRALVMLTCLVAIPLAAVFGTPLPQMFKALGEGRWNDCWALACDSLPRDSSQPASSGADEPVRLPSTGADALDQFQPDPTTEPASPATAAGYLAGASQSEAIRASYQTAADSRRVPSIAPSNAISTSLVPVSPSDQTERLPAADREITPAVQPPMAAPTDRFVYIQNRLRHLGATYYLLESWGGQDQLYRFYCKMAVGGNSAYNRYFEATDADALQAMAKVLAEVEAWKNGRP